MSVPKNRNGAEAEDICLSCGLCCNGVIFGDVKLQQGDDAQRLRAIGLRFAGGRGAPRSPQPCAAFDGCRCRIYPERPQYCRKFECLLLQSVKAKRLTSAAALRTIRAAQKRATLARRLLRELGDTGEQVSLNARFRRTARRLDETGVDAHTGDLYSQLTLVMHDLHLLLSEAFYPGAP